MKLGQNVSDQLQKLGISQEVVAGQMARLDRSSLARLSRLGNGFNAVGQPPGNVRINKFSRKVNDSRQDIPKPWSNLTPSRALRTRARFLSPTYYQAQAQLHPTADDPLPALLNRHTKRGAMMVQRLQNDELTRKAFEHGTQLIVVDDGRTDGAVSVSAMNGGSQTSSYPGAPPQNFMDIFAAMDAAVMAEAASIGLGVTGAAGLIFGSSGAYGSSTGSDAWTGYGMGGAVQGGSAEATNDESVDLMTFKLKRLMDKRQQAYDLFRTVFDKHNEAAKQSINNMRA